MSSKKLADERKKIFGNRLKEIRNYLGLAQNTFAEQINASAGFISEIENGLKMPGTDILASLKQNLHVNINWFITGIGDMFETSYAPEAEGVAEPVESYAQDIKDLLKAAADILRSDNETIKSALKSNIIAFHYTVKCDKEIKTLKRDVDAMKKILNPGAPNTKAKDK